MAEELLSSLKQTISCLSLHPSGGGCFEVTVDGERIYSKLETGQFPESSAILEKLQAKA
ncbi:MAG: selenoprotein [Planctomycetaceae bacterium]|nr:selenoprotein [Planctomycetaceae bacterium]